LNKKKKEKGKKKRKGKEKEKGKEREKERDSRIVFSLVVRSSSISSSCKLL
jgi:hypothetical protein